jgi:hypothetical protein
MAFIAIRVEVSRPTCLPVMSAIASATRLQYFAIASELASCSRCRATEWASTPSSQMSVSASASIPRARGATTTAFPSLSPSGHFLHKSGGMCNLYSLTDGQAAIRDLFRATSDRSSNMPLLLTIFPDQFAPIVCTGAM